LRHARQRLEAQISKYVSSHEEKILIVVGPTTAGNSKAVAHALRAKRSVACARLTPFIVSRIISTGSQRAAPRCGRDGEEGLDDVDELMPPARSPLPP
jgi:hypothetical protein